MMWNWLTNKLGRGVQVRRKKVEIDIPYAQHRYRIEDLDKKTPCNARQQQSNKLKSFN